MQHAHVLGGYSGGVGRVRGVDSIPRSVSNLDVHDEEKGRSAPRRQILHPLAAATPENASNSRLGQRVRHGQRKMSRSRYLEHARVVGGLAGT